MNARRLPSDAGVALVTVLVMLAILSALTIVVVEASRFSIRRTANQAAMDQAHWYLLGAETYAVSQIERLTNSAADVVVDETDWQDRDVAYPLDGGGMMVLRLRDGSNCFNLNSVVDQVEGGRYVASARGQAQFARLLDLMEVRSGIGLPAALADWIDSDSEPVTYGAEDSAYAAANVSQRPPNTLIGDISELRLVRGFTDEIVQTIAPAVCVRPTPRPATLNVNTMLPDQAVVLAAVFGADLPLSTAREVIRRRPRGGWDGPDSFFFDPRVSGLETPDALRAQISTTSNYYVLAAHVRIDGAEEYSLALIGAAGAPQVIRRIVGVGAGDRVL